MQRYTIFFITVNALHVSGAQNSTRSIWYVPLLLAATSGGSSKQAVQEFLMMGGEPA
jgi:hypothetical protein